MLVFIVKMARKYIQSPAKRGRKPNAYMDESIRQKAVIVQRNSRRHRSTSSGAKMSACVRQPLKGEWSQASSSCYEWDELGQYSHRHFCRFSGLTERSKHRNNDSPRFDCHVLINFQQYYQPIIQVAASWGVSVGLYWSGSYPRNVWCRRRDSPQNAPPFTELREEKGNLVTLISLVCQTSRF